MLISALGFRQVYTLHVMHESKMVPCVYALLPNQTKATYLRFFRALQDIADIPFAPDSVQVDFEQAVIQAVEFLWPSTTIHGVNSSMVEFSPDTFFSVFSTLLNVYGVKCRLI